MKNLAKKELARRELARRRLVRFTQYNFPSYKANWHHTILAEKLEAVERGEIKRLIVNMPPRHGKSELVSVHFPAWFLGRNPEKEIIAASYSADLAVGFGRKTRNLARQPSFKQLFKFGLAEDSKSVSEWHTAKGGSYIAVGVGGAITGKGADVLLIDDPLKGREDAESDVIRTKLWDWYRSTAYTRLSPTGAVVIVQCMTGDTSVLMADGTEQALCDIRVGDNISTYDNGRLSTSTVKNWGSNGDDKVFTITTSSGKVVRANERHPFLVYENGELKWIRVKDLNTTQQIVTLKDSGANGRGRRAWTRSVANQPRHEGIVRPTTTRRCGQMGIALRLLTQNRIVTHTLNIVTGLLQTNLIKFLKSKMVSVQFVNNHQGLMSVPTGAGSSALTIATTPTRSEDSSVMTATSQSDMPKTKKPHLLWQSTSEFTLDNIVSIKEDGVEEVFDIQVDRTENFIANGIVSHNTRWHDNDLSGRLLNQEDELADDWEVVDFPAIATGDEEFRKEGEALWDSRFNLKALAAIKANIGSYEWSSLYQQNPIDAESQEFKKEWFKYRTMEEVQKLSTRNFLTIDTAISQKATGDFTGWVENFVDQENFWNIKSKKMKIGPGMLINMLFDSYAIHHWEKIGIEKTIYLDSIKEFMDDEMRKRNIYLPIVELKHEGTKKEIRIRGVIPRYERGGIFHLEGTCKTLEEELLRFPKATHDDESDSLAYQNQIAEQSFGGDVNLNDPDFGLYNETYN